MIYMIGTKNVSVKHYCEEKKNYVHVIAPCAGACYLMGLIKSQRCRNSYAYTSTVHLYLVKRICAQKYTNTWKPKYERTGSKCVMELGLYCDVVFCILYTQIQIKIQIRERRNVYASVWWSPVCIVMLAERAGFDNVSPSHRLHSARIRDSDAE